ncbi:MAG: CrcB family protein [Salinibacterium sp.]|nr:CrcB family protein [Salinibacterium sp.]
MNGTSNIRRDLRRDLAAVVVGGMLGTGLRLAIELLIPHADSEPPWGILAANTLGAFALGLLVTRLWPVAPDWLRAGLGAGLLGSFTTFSAVAVAFVGMTVAEQLLPAVGYLAATLLLGFNAAALGLRIGRGRGHTVALDVIDGVNE